jgi:NADPH:quinone reductase-like Zn-dependent oxidoreductase
MNQVEKRSNLRLFIVLSRQKVVIDRCYPLEQAAEAYRYVESGQKQGNVILKVAHDGRY